MENRLNRNVWIDKLLYIAQTDEVCPVLFIESHALHSYCHHSLSAAFYVLIHHMALQGRWCLAQMSRKFRQQKCNCNYICLYLNNTFFSSDGSSCCVSDLHVFCTVDYSRRHWIGKNAQGLGLSRSEKDGHPSNPKQFITAFFGKSEGGSWCGHDHPSLPHCGCCGCTMGPKIIFEIVCYPHLGARLTNDGSNFLSNFHRWNL